MRPRLRFLLPLFAAVSALAAGPAKPSGLTTTTGWFSDEKCATARVSAGRIGPTGRSCTRECLSRGVRMAFIDEKARRVLRVANPTVARGREGDYVRITGSVSVSGKILRLDSIEVLKPYAAACDAPAAGDSHD